jgi:tetratricopeptide (TPR) repeat protein
MIKPLLRRIALAAAAPFLLASPLLADTLVINNLSYNDIRVTGVRGDEIYFTFSGREIHKPISEITRVRLDDEPALNAAEVAYVANDWDKASDGYERTLRTTQKPWLRDWVSLRLLESANNAGRFDAAIKGYVALVEKNPATARDIRLNMPKPDSTYLDDAVKLINDAVAKSRNDAAKELLLNTLIEVYNAKGDINGANEALRRRMELAAADPTTPEGMRAAALLKLKAIQLALAGKQYDKVIQLIRQDGASFTNLHDQTEALWCLAEAHAGKAAGSADVEVWKDVALGYVRVAAHALQSSPLAAAALLKTAAIHEQHLDEKQTALTIYQQIAADYRNTDAARTAEKEIQRLKQSLP